MMFLDECPYRVEVHGEHARILDADDRVVAECGSEANARHYLVLLEKAYKRGYKDGYRAGKPSGGH